MAIHISHQVHLSRRESSFFIHVMLNILQCVPLNTYDKDIYIYNMSVQIYMYMSTLSFFANTAREVNFAKF